MDDRFNIIDTLLPGLKILQRKPIKDHRGHLTRMFCSEGLMPLTNGKPIVQINHALTIKQGSIRGMHFQHAPFAEIKFVNCIRGAILDVAVDVRQHSPTFLQYHAEILTQDNCKTLVLPEGFAHGFQTLTTDCEIVYLHTEHYHPSAEQGLNALDPALAIQWPLAISERSERDQTYPLLNGEFKGVIL